MNHVLVLSQFCPDGGPSVVFVNERRDINVDIDRRVILNPTHETLDGPVGYFSTTSFESINPKFGEVINRLCTRGLSFESVGPAKEGIVVFSDSESESNGHHDEQYCYSYVFFLKDSKARGYSRWLSLNYMTTSFSEISINWGFLNRCLNILLRLLKTHANSVFQRETGGNIMRDKQFIQRQKQLGKNSFVIKQMQKGMLKQREVKSTMERDHRMSLRKLEDLLNIKNIHKVLHKNCSSLVKGVAERFVYIDLTQFDHVLQQTRQIRKKFHHHHVVMREDQAISVLLDFHRATLKFLSYPKKRRKGEADSRTSETFSKYLEETRRFGTDVMEVILFCVLVGHQVVLMGEDKEFLFHLLLAFQDFLPDYSRDNVVFSIDYIKSLRFLILRTSVAPPSRQKSKPQTVKKKASTDLYGFIKRKRIDLRKAVVVNLFDSSFKQGITNLEMYSLVSLTPSIKYSPQTTVMFSSLVRFFLEKVLYVEDPDSGKKKEEPDIVQNRKKSKNGSKSSIFSVDSGEDEVFIVKSNSLVKTKEEIEREKKMDCQIRIRQIKRLIHKCNIIVNLLVNQNQRIRDKVLAMFYVNELDRYIILNYVNNYERNQKELEMIRKHQKKSKK